MRDLGRTPARIGVAVALGAFGAAAVLASGGCSILLDLTADQCTTTADCTNQGADFASYVCDTSAHVCVPPATSQQDGGGGGGEGCTSNKACSDENGQVPYICKTPGTPCTKLYSDDCQKIIGDYTDDNAVFYGILLNHSASTYVTAPIDGIDLAVEEITKNVVGLPFGKDGSRRPLVFISCDTANDKLRAAKHLIEDIGVPAIVGPSNSDDLVEVALKEAVPKGVMLLSPQATSPQLRKLSDQGLVWQMTPLDDRVAGLWAKFLPDLENDIKTKLGVTQLKIAVVASKYIWAQSTADAFANDLVFNGKSGLDNAADNPPAFKRYDYDPQNPDFAPIINDLIDNFQPNIIIPLNNGEAQLGLQVPLEQNWPAGVPKPVHLMLSASDTDDTSKMAQTLGADFMKRTFKSATAFPPDGTNYKNFLLRFQGKFNKAPLNTAAYGYDAGYLLAYASVGAGQVPKLTGNLIAQGMLKVLGPGPVTNVGPDALNDGFTALVANGTIDFQGAYGDYAFDSTGENSGYFNLECGKPAGIWTDSGWTYSTATGEFTGTFNCTLPY